MTRVIVWTAGLLFSFALAAGAARMPASSVPTFVPGETLSYLLQYRSTIESQDRGPIYTPAAAHRLNVTLGARMRLEVLEVENAPRRGRLTRLRVTYETCDARVHGDAYDPGAQLLQKQLRRMQGRSFEFTIDAQGHIVNMVGLDRVEPDQSARNAIRQWLSTVTLPLGAWKPGLKPGKKWSREFPVEGIPLRGLAWRTESAYRDDEPCPAPPGAAAGAHFGTCAVVTSRLLTVRKNPHGNPTPPAYLRQGLKTSGHWAAQGESLSYVSLSSGLVVSSTATESDAMNLTIAASLSGSRLHYSGRSTSSAQITLIAVKVPAGQSGGTRSKHGRPNGIR